MYECIIEYSKYVYVNTYYDVYYNYYMVLNCYFCFVKAKSLT